MAEPYWQRFCTPLALRILDLIGGGQAEAGAFIREEHIEAVVGDGRYRVGGDVLPTKGKAQLSVGQRVHVLWRRGRRERILTHQWKRAQPHPTMGGGGGVVEALFIAPVGATLDVYFRNDQQVTMLVSRATLDADPMVVRWGVDGRSFVVLTTTWRAYIYALDRAADQVYGSTRPLVTLVREENFLDAGIGLCTVQESATITGETRYFNVAWPGAPGDPNAATLSEAGANAISRSLTVTGPMALTRLGVLGSASPSRAPTVMVTGVHLDGARHLIVVLAVNVRGLWGQQSSGSGATSHPIQKSDGSGTVEDNSDDITVNPPTTEGNHLFVVNTTAGAVLFRTCLANVVLSGSYEAHRFHTYKNVGTPTPPGAVGDNTIADMPTFLHLDKAGQLVSWASDGGGTADVTFTPALVAWENRQRPALTSFVAAEHDAAALPYIDVSGLVGIETAPLEFAGMIRARYPADTSFGSKSFRVLVQTTRKRVWEARRYTFSGVYLPAVANAPAGTLGHLLVHVREENKTSALSPPTLRQGFYLHNLGTGAVTTLVAIADHGGGGGQGVHLPMTTPPRFFFHLAPATEGEFVVLSFDGVHLYWLHRKTDGSADVKLTQLGGATAVVLSGRADAAGAGQFGQAGYDAPMRTLLARLFQVLRPGVMYYPSDTDTEKGNRFIVGWDETGLPILDASAEGFPAELAALRDLGKQAPLAGVEPKADTILAVNNGPINLTWGETGPSWRVVPTSAVKGAAG